MLAHYRASASPKALGVEFLKRTPAKKLHRRRRRNQRLADVGRAGLDTSRVEFVEHHTCHASAAYWGPPWRDEPILVMTCDGAGDNISAIVSIARPQEELERIAHVSEDSSLGGIYATITFALGLTPNDHEYKLMGLAPYAPTAGARAVLSQLQDLFPSMRGLSGGSDPGARPTSTTPSPTCRSSSPFTASTRSPPGCSCSWSRCSFAGSARQSGRRACARSLWGAVYS
jgi:predicted NodU family carbamoyl transferase